MILLRNLSAPKMALLTLALVCWALPAYAWNPIILPDSTVEQVLTASQVNQELIDQGSATPQTLPFAVGTDVYQLKLTKAMYAVRYFQNDPSRLRGGGVGGWVMSGLSVRGMNSYQVRSLYALPAHPDHVIVVRVPVGTELRTGTAGPIAGWGDGGGQQFYMLGRIALDNYGAIRTTTDLLYTGALADNVGGGNASQVGRYLDGATAPNYSLLEVTELMLSYLPDNGQRKWALNQLGPERFDSLSRLAIRQDILFSQALSQRRNDLRTSLMPEGADAGAAKAPLQKKIGDTYVWGRAVGAMGDAKSTGDNFGFDYKTGGVLGGADFLMSPNFILGFGGGYMQSQFDWKDAGGQGSVSGLKLGMYASYFSKGYFLDGAITGGYNLEDVTRGIDFPGMDYNARSHPDGYGLSAGIDGGLNFLLGGWTLQPLAGLNFYYVSNNSFSETNAESLDLNVDSFQASALRSELALRLSRAFTLDSGAKLVPMFRAGWAHQFVLGDRDISASLVDQAGNMTVKGYDKDTDAFLPGLGITMVCASGTQFYLRYDGEMGGDLTAHEVQAGVRIPF